MLFFSLLAAAQPGGDLPEKIQRPKLVVGIVVDQMRWDYPISTLTCINRTVVSEE